MTKSTGIRVLTYRPGGSDDVEYITQEQWDAGMRLPDDWEDFIWHENAESIEWAVKNHDWALDEWASSDFAKAEAS